MCYITVKYLYNLKSRTLRGISKQLKDFREPLDGVKRYLQAVELAQECTSLNLFDSRWCRMPTVTAAGYRSDDPYLLSASLAEGVKKSGTADGL
ncbi:MAG TPA: hypothetical protein DCM45_04300 [Clostridiales bacterium]|nr:hypothetical protein [Clostridiales bacterium]